MIYNFIQIPELVLKHQDFRYAAFTISGEKIRVENFESPSKLMLGKQAEFCFEYFLKQSKRYQLLANNIQVQGKTETLGELDYLIFDTQENKTLHIELACKFYLFDASLGKDIEEKWIGPNRKDTLKEKLKKLKTKQFPLLFKAETVEILQKLNLNPFNIEQKIYLKAVLFLPKNFQKTVPREYKKCVAGYYIHFQELKENREAVYAIPDKKEWLFPAEKIDNWYSFAKIKQIVSEKIQQKRAPMVYKKAAANIEKFFVVWW